MTLSRLLMFNDGEMEQRKRKFLIRFRFDVFTPNLHRFTDTSNAHTSKVRKTLTKVFCLVNLFLLGRISYAQNGASRVNCFNHARYANLSVSNCKLCSKVRGPIFKLQDKTSAQPSLRLSTIFELMGKWRNAPLLSLVLPIFDQRFVETVHRRFLNRAQQHHTRSGWNYFHPSVLFEPQFFEPSPLQSNLRKRLLAKHIAGDFDFDGSMGPGFYGFCIHTPPA